MIDFTLRLRSTCPNAAELRQKMVAHFAGERHCRIGWEQAAQALEVVDLHVDRPLVLRTYFSPVGIPLDEKTGEWLIGRGHTGSLSTIGGGVACMDRWSLLRRLGRVGLVN